MQIALVSDTHGNLPGMLLLIEHLKRLGITTLFHLGDDYRDLSPFREAGLEVHGVPGVYCPEYRDPAVPNRMTVSVEGVKFLLTHTETRHKNDQPGDPDPQLACHEADVVLFGHSHRPTVEERNGIPWINPGHLKEQPDRGQPPTFAVLELNPPSLHVKVFRLEDGQVVHERTFVLKERGHT